MNSHMILDESTKHTLIRLLPKFAGHLNEDPHHHLQVFEKLDVLGLQNWDFSEEDKKTILFPWSLIEEAEEWYLTYASGVFLDWESLHVAFLSRFVTPAVVTKRLEAVLVMKQGPDETYTQYFNRWKEGIQGVAVDMTVLLCFVDGLRTESEASFKAALGDGVEFFQLCYDDAVSAFDLLQGHCSLDGGAIPAGVVAGGNDELLVAVGRLFSVYFNRRFSPPGQKTVNTITEEVNIYRMTRAQTSMPAEDPEPRGTISP